jgi:CRISPR-associated exonuclease Cas4
MHAGIAAHRMEEKRDRRRSLLRYGLEKGERHYEVSLYSPRLALRGVVDLVIVASCGGDREAIPVDYKFARRVHRSWKQQLAAYGMLLEDVWGIPVRRGYIYLLMMRRAEMVRISAREKGAARAMLRQIREMIAAERTPEPPRTRGRCVDCEFRRFCNDVF